MKKYLLITAFCSIISFVNAAEIIRGPYVEDPQQTTAVIKWATDVPSAAWIEYGPDGKCSQLMAISSKKTEHSLVLHGLIPNTKFCYKIYVQNAGETGAKEPQTGTFKTLFSPERKIVNFLVVGNTSEPEGTVSSEELKSTMAAAMSGYEADFLIHTGNIASTGLASDNNPQFLKPFKKILQNSPLLVALGEDEFGPDRYDAKDGRGFLTANYRRIHTMPWSKGTPSYYFIDTANARIIFIDTNFAYDVLNASKLDLKTPQYEWLASSLASTPENTWKIVVMHHPAYSSGPAPDKLSALLAPLFEMYKVNLVIQGHQGAYERTTPILKAEKAKLGPTYITIGGGGKILSPKMYENAWGSKYYNIPHFAHIQIVDRKLSLRVYTHDNKRIDALDIYF